MKRQILLVPLDGSELAEAALTKAEELAALMKEATLLLLRAAEVHTFPGVDPTEAQEDRITVMDVEPAAPAASAPRQEPEIQAAASKAHVLASPAVRQWIQATYGEFVLPVEIPKTTVTSSKSAEFATAYDVQRYDGSAKTYKRALDAYDRFVDLIEESVVEAWRSRASAA